VREAQEERGWERHTSQSRKEDVSKRLSLILRHTGPKNNVYVAQDGWADLANVMGCIPISALFTTVQEITEVVHTNDKGRFQIKEWNGQLMIRAVQGHSIRTVRTDLIATPIMADTLPPVIVHGTTSSFSESIRLRGLLAGGLAGTRNDVHFATGVKGVRSGMRRSCDMFVYLDGQRALEQNLPLFRSDNDVIVSKGIGGAIPSCLLWATDSNGNELWNGVKDSHGLDVSIGNHMCVLDYAC